MDRSQIYRSSFNTVFLIILFAAGILLATYEPFKRGFFCDDESLKYPFIKNDTVTVLDLALIVLVVPFITIIISEILFYRLMNKKYPLQNVDFILHTLSILSDWFLATCISFITTNFIKAMVGRYRPMFMDACKPNIDCNLPAYQGKYITNFECLEEQWPLEQLRKSFPSGHSSESMVAMTYIALYLNKRYKRFNFCRFLIVILQLIFILISIFVGLSRIQDFRHHWSDVLAGFLLGSMIALISTRLTGKLDDLSIYTLHKPPTAFTVQDKDIEPI